MFWNEFVLLFSLKSKLLLKELAVKMARMLSRLVRF